MDLNEALRQFCWHYPRNQSQKWSNLQNVRRFQLARAKDEKFFASFGSPEKYFSTVLRAYNDKYAHIRMQVLLCILTLNISQKMNNKVTRYETFKLQIQTRSSYGISLAYDNRKFENTFIMAIIIFLLFHESIQLGWQLASIKYEQFIIFTPYNPFKMKHMGRIHKGYLGLVRV